MNTTRQKSSRNLILKIIAGILSVVMCFICAACNNEHNPSSPGNGSESEKYDQEQYEFEHFCFETLEQMELFYEYLDSEIYALEMELPDGVENEVYCFEEKIEEDFSEGFFNRIPNEILLYDIDWATVLSKYAVGTAVIIVSGILTVATLETPICYVFATAFTSATKEALVGGTVGAVLSVVINSAKDGAFNKVDATKYALEGSADGFMWGAISGAILGLIQGAVTVKTPGNYFSSDGLDLLGRLDSAGNFVDDVGNYIGKARVAANGNTYIVDDTGKVLYMFSENSSFASANIVKAYNDIDVIRSVGRFAGPNLTVDGVNVYKNGKLIGKLNEVGDVIGVGQYEGQLLYSINANGYISTNNFRAVQAGITTNSVGTIANKFILNQGDEVLNGGAKIYGQYVLNNNSMADVVQYTSDGVTKYYLMGTNNKILACLDDSMQIMEGWNKMIASSANSGVNTAKKMIIKMIQNNKNFDYGPSFKDDIIQAIKESGKMPKGFQGHHINNVANYPWLADNANNIMFYSRADHLHYGHNGSWANASTGELTDLINTFFSIFGG